MSSLTIEIFGAAPHWFFRPPEVVRRIRLVCEANQLNCLIVNHSYLEVQLITSFRRSNRHPVLRISGSKAEVDEVRRTGEILSRFFPRAEIQAKLFDFWWGPVVEK
jgi:hypothetical protein